VLFSFLTSKRAVFVFIDKDFANAIKTWSVTFLVRLVSFLAFDDDNLFPVIGKISIGIVSGLLLGIVGSIVYVLNNCEESEESEDLV
jgi:hypothetical protein